MFFKITRRIKLFKSPKKEFYLFLKNLTGYYPEKLALYNVAFTHRSASRVDSQGTVVNNERLEYLGDAILGAVIADFLYNRFPQEHEGFLTKMRSKLVNRAILTSLTYEMGLNVFIDSNTMGPTDKSHIFGDVLEALIGAVYLDHGYPAAKYFITKRILSRHVDLHEMQTLDLNYKSTLIEWGQKNKRDVRFSTVEEHPDNGKPPRFLSSVIVDGVLAGKGPGGSKKESQQNAAKESLKKLKITLP